MKAIIFPFVFLGLFLISNVADAQEPKTVSKDTTKINPAPNTQVKMKRRMMRKKKEHQQKDDQKITVNEDGVNADKVKHKPGKAEGKEEETQPQKPELPEKKEAVKEEKKGDFFF